MKIDKRKKYYMVFDTETLDNEFDEKGQINRKKGLVYDLGFVVVDKLGTVYEQKSFVIQETFFGLADLMQSCYYANKIANYLDEIDKGEREVLPFYLARKIMFDIAREYNITDFVAFNAWFDFSMLNNTMSYLTDNKYNKFFWKEHNILDSMQMARYTIGKQKLYIKWCYENGFLTKAGKPKLNVETLYRYMSNNKNFDESHTGLEDAIIESQIMILALRQHKKMKGVNILEKYRNKA